MEQQQLRWIFGPVLSGRLGRSLGLDLLGRRVCSMNCVYCESGRLETLTKTRAAYVPAQDLLAELSAWEAARVKAGEPLPDVVTLGGMGEPTLNADMRAIIAGARAILPGVPVAVLTNASLMTDATVRAELAQADIILPSLDSLVPEEFARVNRGCPDLDPNAIADGILRFRQDYNTLVWLEILLVAGVNDTEANLALLMAYCKRLQPQRVDVTTLSRPGTEAWARPVDRETLARWRALLSAAAGLSGAAGAALAQSSGALAPGAEKGQDQPSGHGAQGLEHRLLATLARRPQTAEQLASALLASEGAVAEALAGLLRSGAVEEIPPAAPTEPESAGGPGLKSYFRARS